MLKRYLYGQWPKNALGKLFTGFAFRSLSPEGVSIMLCTKFYVFRESRLINLNVSFLGQGNRSVPFSIVIGDSSSRNSGVLVVLVDRNCGVCMHLVTLIFT
jgi:hypothetical protein